MSSIISNATMAGGILNQTMLDQMATIGTYGTYGTGLSAAAIQHPQFGYATEQTMIYHASVERAENGYILKVVHKQNEAPKIYIAFSTEDLQQVFIAAIVAERISK